MKGVLAPGDRVTTSDGMTGTVACNIGDCRFSTSHPEHVWAVLEKGVLVLTDEAGLVHYSDATDLRLIA